MKLFKDTEENIILSSKIIKDGGLVAFPTETVYGLGADGLNPIAVAKIFEAKNRPTFNPLILHIADKKSLDRIAYCESEKIKKLIDSFWPGPLTLVLPKKEIVPDIVTAGNETVAVRMPDHQVALKLITFVGNPLAAPSANAFGFLSPTEAAHVAKQLSGKIDAVLDGGKCKVGVESTILQITEEGAVLLRPGGIAVEEIEELIGKVEINTEDKVQPNSPGQLPYHYSPKKPLRFLDEIKADEIKEKKIGAVFFSEIKTVYEFDEIRVLSNSGNKVEAAANLFSVLHDLENKEIDLIIAEKIDEAGLGLAIMDRLRRASKRF